MARSLWDRSLPMLFGVILCAFLLDASVASAQVTVVLSQPPPNQLRIADLWHVTLISTARQSEEVYLEGIATESKDGRIVFATSRTFSLPAGKQLAVTGSQLEPIDVKESNPRYRSIVTRTGTVPSGEYEICVYVRRASDDAELGRDCITQIVERLSPPILIAPTDESTVEEPLPLFTWTPPVPTPQGGPSVTYTLRVVEILGRQTPYDALQSNPAFFERANIPTTTFQYPGSARSFETNKRYAWRISAVSNRVELGESEVWQFTRKPQLLALNEVTVNTKAIASLLTFKADRLVGGKGHSAALVANSGGSGGSKGPIKTLKSNTPEPLDAQLWTWGNNEYGQLGTGGVPATARSTATSVTALNHTRDVALGSEHGLAVQTTGTISAWGGNDFGQLGLGNDNAQNVPKPIPSFSGAIDVAAGNYHSVALKSDGTVWTWGYNRSGELGLNDLIDRNKPAKVSITGATAIAAGDGHTLVLKNDGTVWAWGTNRSGQADPRFGSDPVIVIPKKVEGLSNVKAIAAGGNFSLALLEDGTVKAWGGNNSGQLGNGTADADAKLVKEFIIGYLGTTESSGGTPSTGSFRNRIKQISPAGTSGIARQMEFGYIVTNLNGIVTVSSLNNVTEIDAGGAHAIARRSDSTVWTWGNNYWGTLGTGGRESHTGPTRVLGINDAVSVAAGSDHSFAVLKNGTVNAWGSNMHKQLGMSSVPASIAPDGEDFATTPVAVPKN